LFIIDIAVPRDVEPGVGKITNVFLYDIDDLQQVLEANLEQRRREVPRVQSIVSEEVAGFLAWLRARDVVPT
ncbi:MAG: glutamyl-tRNA reductase, partial [Anaerolineae bacterium]|nr:glutamyl-tRNA reductase [Anaerolineae bacterium]